MTGKDDAVAPMMTAQAATYAAAVIDAARQGSRVLPVSTIVPDITVPQGYAIQHALVAAARDRGDAIVGFKGSLVAPGSMVGGTAVAPVVGVLLRSGELVPNATVSRGVFRQLVIECEIAFTFARRVTTRIASVSALRPLVAAIRPAFELPDFSLEGTMRHPADLIAINAAVSHQILGPASDLATPLAAIVPTLFRDGAPIATGDVAATVGDPWETLLTLVNLALELGYVIEPGQSILTGATILAFDTQRGTYRVDFGALGSVAFTLVD